MSIWKILPEGPRPYLWSLVGEKDPSVTDPLKDIPGVTWDPTGRRWLFPVEMVDDIIAQAETAECPHFNPPNGPLIWAASRAPTKDDIGGRFVVSDGNRYCNGASQRTQGMVTIISGQELNPFIITSVNPLTEGKKIFSLLELAFPGRFGRHPNRYDGEYRFLLRYFDYEETRFEKKWLTANDAALSEYLHRLSYCVVFDRPDAPELPARGLFD